jgi:small subunit ribosomal protein S14
MARKSQIEKQRHPEKLQYPVRRNNRCNRCGRGRAYIRKFGVCRICFREMALRGEIPGVRKASW